MTRCLIQTQIKIKKNIKWQLISIYRWQLENQHTMYTEQTKEKKHQYGSRYNPIAKKTGWKKIKNNYAWQPNKMCELCKMYVKMTKWKWQNINIKSYQTNPEFITKIEIRTCIIENPKVNEEIIKPEYPKSNCL